MKTAFLKTIIYADIFDYPLTKEEINYWLIPSKSQNSSLIEEKEGFYFLKGRKKIINLRKLRNKYSKKKYEIATTIIETLKLIPTIKLIGITGALSVDNSDKNDDIDLFIITQKNTLWTTRFLATLMLDILRVRRKPYQNEIANKICLNMFVDENHLKIPPKEQDLYTAHEVLQMKPLWEKDNIYQKFLSQNQWVKKYLPNAYKPKDTSDGKDTSEVSEGLLGWWRKQQSLLETLLKKLQLWYMKNRRTTEIINEGIIRFHPQDARIWIMEKYRKKLKDLNLKA
ncbi:hypothetical protein HYW54_03420 [Candidatus Gottesmanbacteria bacterium]|nr:hypothetical protein [Candidatus Gottesmanbacteria bacterium]